jgi:hypothetical protein
MEIKFEYHQTRLDVYLNGSLAIQGVELIGYEIKNKNNLDRLIERPSLKIALIKPTKDTIVFEFLGIDAWIVLRTTETSQVNVTNAKMVIYHGDTETLLY